MKVLPFCIAILCQIFSGNSFAKEARILNELCDSQILNEDQCLKLKKESDSLLLNQSLSGKSNDFFNDGRLTFSSPDSDFKFMVKGRIHIDAAVILDDNKELVPGNGTEIRRARLSLSGKQYQDWQFKLRVDFSGNSVSMKDVYFGYAPLNLTVGLSKVLFSMEDKTSTNDIIFMERALNNAFAPGRRIGGGWNISGETAGLSINLFGQGVSAGEEGDEGVGLASRFIHAPVNEPRSLIHYGFSLAIEQSEDDVNQSTQFRERPESHITEYFLDAGVLTDINYISSQNLEFATVMGSFAIQAEYTRVNLTRNSNREDLKLHGGYLAASWILTGESRSYKEKTGLLKGLKPSAKSGAWELAVRYSTLNFSDVNSGIANNYTAGVNWYANPRIRFMSNVVKVNSNEQAGNNDSLIVQFRSQMTF